MEEKTHRPNGRTGERGLGRTAFAPASCAALSRAFFFALDARGRIFGARASSRSPVVVPALIARARSNVGVAVLDHVTERRRQR